MRFLNKFLALVIIVLAGVLFFQATKIDPLFWHYLNREPQLTVSSPLKEIIPSENLTYQQYIDRGSQLADQGLIEFAVAHYARAATIEPDSASPFIAIANTYYDHGEFSRAVQNSQKAIDKNPSSAPALTILAKSYLAAGNIEEALLSFNKISELNAEGSYFYGILATISEDRDTAGELLHSTIQIANMDPTPENIEWKDKAQRIINAYHYYDEYRDSPNPHFRALLAQALSENDQPHLALSEIKKLLTEIPEYRDAWIIQGHIELQLGDYQAAIQSFQSAIDLDQTLPAPYYYLALTYLNLEKPDLASTSLDQAIELGWDDQTALAEKKALVHIQKEEWSQAASEYEKILGKNHELTPQFFIKPLWIFWEKIQDPSRALEPTASLVTQHPQSPLAHALRGRAFFNTEDYSQAKTEYDIATQIDPELPELHLYLGDWYLASEKDKSVARDHFKKAYELDPDGEVGAAAAERYNSIR